MFLIITTKWLIFFVKGKENLVDDQNEKVDLFDAHYNCFRGKLTNTEPDRSFLATLTRPSLEIRLCFSIGRDSIQTQSIYSDT